ncbi:hypothetical protein PHMEG_0005598 [Phytophthora megakarya]|uniref:Uncharacterized protein n=1 Tax=Phytophthora megakarya TaxID=4795 RepID=A0A225WR62_9STRA|nr:hypothetical protein PHMEG_0005592 [Phytophthora megakarya]OWZ20052.1 hypothetical protein PHMEG_0005598 [Phytophthora megakarya]
MLEGEAFNELASLLQSKVDKNDLTSMLQSVAYGNHLYGRKRRNLSQDEVNELDDEEHDGYLSETLASS